MRAYQTQGNTTVGRHMVRIVDHVDLANGTKRRDKTYGVPMPVVHYLIDDDIHARAKAAAAVLRMSLKEFLEQALDEKAQKVETRQARKKPPS